MSLRTPTLAMVASLIVLLATQTSVAVIIAFDNDQGNGLWRVDANWVGDVKPGVEDIAIFDTFTVEVDATTNEILERAVLADFAGSTTTLNINGGELALESNFDLGSLGHGIVNVNSGTVHVANRMRMGVDANQPDARGTLNVLGGTVEVGERIVMGSGVQPGGANFTQQITVTSGLLTAAALFVGDETNSTGRVDVTGGEITVGDLGVPTNANNNNDGHVQLDGGIIRVTNPTEPLSVQGVGGAPAGLRIINDPGSTGAEGTFDITGGTLLLAGDATAAVQEYISLGTLTAFGGAGTLVYDFDARNVGFTTVTAVIFDAPTGNTCTVLRSSSNTPLQALALLNDETMMDAARGLGRRIVREGPREDAARIAYAFRISLTRPAGEVELRELLTFHGDQQARLASGELDATSICGAHEAPEGTKLQELAAWTAVARLLLNLDEAISRQ